MQGEALERAVKCASSHRFYSPVAVGSSGLERHFVVKFHFMLCVSADLIESLVKLGQVAVRSRPALPAPTDLCS